MAGTVNPPATAPVHFVEAIDTFRSKTNIPTNTWTDLIHAAHTRAWSVAGATSSALLADLRGAIDAAIATGGTLEQFRAEFDQIVARHGWSYRGGRNWRTKVIFQTNMRMAVSVGRWTQAQRLKATRPWMRYVAVQDLRTRPEHAAWHDTIAPLDAAWWKTHWPPNGWNCRCHVQSLSDRDLKRYGLKPKDPPPTVMEARQITAPDGSVEIVPTPAGVDTGFGYNPGQSWERGVVPPQLRQPLPDPPTPPPAHNLPPLPPRPAPAVPMLPPGLSDVDYVRAFLNEFGGDIGRPVMFRDVGGTRLTITEELFKTASGGWKVQKQGREAELLALAAALRNPDEIWLLWTELKGPPPRWVLRRRYITRVTLPGRGGALSIFEWTSKGWDGTTNFPPDTASYLERQRTGVLLYRRP